MARSQLLTDLASGNDIESVLFRLKIILSDLENESIDKWLDNEIEGYDPNEELPSYRILQGRVMGSYILSSTFDAYEYTSALIPINHIPIEERETLLTAHTRYGISSLKNMLKTNEKLAKQISPEDCHKYSREGFTITKMYIEFGLVDIEKVIAKIKNTLLKIILKLEKEFNELDSLDIFTDVSNKELIEQTEQFIINILLDNSITIGDNNKIKSSEIGHNKQ